ncbi:MAG TPA: alpha/beta fold hydrolase, partial [Amnibacterium sp.]|uniref:alpha/beta hydrolase n=1 Tax=Amnibacterium sp. TaxID=1872496 RepID=UPI002F951408
MIAALLPLRGGAGGRASASLLALLGLVAVLLGLPAPAAAAAPTVRSFFVPVPDSPGSAARIRIDADIYTPASTPAPAVLLAHGFGQDKTALASEARRLQREGFVVLAYSARGFGRSGGRIGLDSLDAEVPDARALVDVLARTPAVRKVGSDPVVGVVGGSYGGALALMLGATDPRIDTVVAAITWNDLAQALVPASAGTVVGAAATPLRDFKVGWSSRLFGDGLGASADPCGRFTPAFCSLYERLITGAAPTSGDLALLKRSSPSTVLSGMRAPTLLLQGLQDSLFGLDQADADARQIAAAGAPVQVRWFDGGHDGGGTSGTDGVVDAWLAAHLQHHEAVPATFTYDVPASTTSFPETITAPRYRGLGGDPGGAASVPLGGPGGVIVNPPGGRPSSVTSLPGLGAGTAVGRAAGGLLARANPPAESVRFASAGLAHPILLAGAARVRLR